MIAWCGSRADGLGWLCDRCGSLDTVEVGDSISIEVIDEICSQAPRRLILSVENRLSYPVAEIQHLQRAWPEVPFALAFGSWFDGSRRTGIGTASHLSLPWYRWWDGWRQWLVGSNAKLLDPWPQAMLTRLRVGTEFRTIGKTSGVIVSNCHQTAAGWQAGFECDLNSTKLLTLKDFRSTLVQASSNSPAWILWDDTCLNSFAGASCLSEVCELVAAIRVRFSDVVILTATSMPRWTDWQQWMLAGADELLAKPTPGIFLSQVIQRS